MHAIFDVFIRNTIYFNGIILIFHERCRKKIIFREYLFTRNLYVNEIHELSYAQTQCINFKNLFETKNYPEQLNESFEINFTNLFI